MDTTKDTRPQHLLFLEANEHDLAPLTGTDTKALGAIAASLTLYAYCGREEVLHAVALLVGEMQAKTRPLARELIAFAMDWGDRDRLWPVIERHLEQLPQRSLFGLRAVGGVR